MNSKILVIQCSDISDDLKHHLKFALSDYDYEHYNDQTRLENRYILFVIELNGLGYDLQLLEWLAELKQNAIEFTGSVGGLLIKSPSELYTKSFAQDVILHTNGMGLSFIGHSVIEIIKDYENFATWQKTHKLSLKDICELQCKHLIERLMTTHVKPCEKILALHSSSYKTSNTLGLWHLVKKELRSLKREPLEIHIENGKVVDCKGCSFQTCMHYGESRSCFYGGIMVEEVLPAIEAADTIVWICPNYNDSVSANLLAVINRLTVLYRQISFHEKSFYAVVVSGNSGSDSVAKQLIGALNINKGFYLPAKFSVMAIANDPLKVLEIEGVETIAEQMAQRINDCCR